MTCERLYWYIAVHDAARSAMVAGPYDTEAAAAASREKVERLTHERYPWSWFYRSSLAISNRMTLTVFGRI